MSDRPQLNTARFDELISDVLEGGATPAQVELFNECLRQDPNARLRYIAYIDLHATLAEPAGPLKDPAPDDLPDMMSEIIDQALALRRQHEIEDEANKQLAAQQAEDARNRRFELRRQAQPEPARRVIVIPKAIVWLGLAAVMGITATVAVYFDKSDSSSTQIQPGPTARVPDRETIAQPPVVAHVRSSVGARWSGRIQDNSTLLRSDTTITLAQGLAEVVFDDGVTLIVQGPTTFEPTGTNGVHLVAGRITATVPDGAQGFTVDTPSGLITDYGTEFGVITNDDGQVFAQIFVGQIGLTPVGGGEEVQLLKDDAVVVNTAGRVREVASNDLAFVHTEEFEAIRESEVSPRARWVAMRYRMLRDPDVLAFVPFIRPESDWPAGFGYNRIRRLDEATATSHSLGPSSLGAPIEWQGEPGVADTLVADGQNPLFIDLDTAPGGSFDDAGLLDRNGLIGRPGTTLYLSWRMQGDGTGFAPADFAGLSLMFGDDREVEEPLFIGVPSSRAVWAVHPRPRGQSGLDDLVRPLLVSSGEVPVDKQPHQFIVQIDFADGPDRVAVYFDPDMDRATLPVANLVLTDYDINFDRLRFVTGNGARAWRIDDVLISTQPPFNTPGTLPGN